MGYLVEKKWAFLARNLIRFHDLDPDFGFRWCECVGKDIPHLLRGLGSYGYVALVWIYVGVRGTKESEVKGRVTRGDAERCRQ